MPITITMGNGKAKVERVPGPPVEPPIEEPIPMAPAPTRPKKKPTARADQ